MSSLVTALRGRYTLCWVESIFLFFFLLLFPSIIRKLITQNFSNQVVSMYVPSAFEPSRIDVASQQQRSYV